MENHPQSINIKDYHGKSSPIHKSKGLSWKSFPIHKLKRLSWIPLLFFFINKANPYGYPLSFLDILEFVKDTSPPLLIKFKCYSLRIPLPQRQERTNKSLELELTPTAFNTPPLNSEYHLSNRSSEYSSLSSQQIVLTTIYN